ncbi:MAG: cytochrome C oxidase subunit IV family protein [Bacteroidetes bacterium]|nr:cytochrome C oxidase subunit IV family protein [Bacteroidota bacterium]
MLRDDIIEYSLDTHHSEEAGKAIRKKIVRVTLLLTLITAVEVFVGILWGRSSTTGMFWETIKWSYIILTLVKAGYIIMVFMHLGDEKKALKWVILGPYIAFIIYLIFIGLTEANAVNDALITYGA